MLIGINIVLTLVWAALLGSIDFSTLTSGFSLSYGILFLIYRNRPEAGKYFSKPPKVIAFVLYYLKELVKSNLIIAHDILTPTHHMKPGVLAIPIRAETDFEITLLANLITMTPGTLSLDVSEDRKTLYVHAMYIHDAEAVRKDITENMERHVLAMLR
ncbi:MAG: Na+/H+ antiporter subunit E [Terrimicrobiaceae bacterium]|nr:Na+/H+ antiporter subunit E [Terrimicrobiaceae bacterium]